MLFTYSDMYTLTGIAYTWLMRMYKFATRPHKLLYGSKSFRSFSRISVDSCSDWSMCELLVFTSFNVSSNFYRDTKKLVWLPVLSLHLHKKYKFTWFFRMSPWEFDNSSKSFFCNSFCFFSRSLSFCSNWVRFFSSSGSLTWIVLLINWSEWKSRWEVKKSRKKLYKTIPCWQHISTQQTC